MNAFWRRKYRAEAAKWAEEGRLAMSVQPRHLLELLQEQAPPLSPSEADRRIAGLQQEVLALRSQLQSETSRANKAHAEGHAKATRENVGELSRLRAAAATRHARDQVQK